MGEELTKSKNLQELGPLILKEGTEVDIEDFLALQKKLAAKTYTPWVTKEQITGDNKFFFVIKVGEKTVGHIYYEIKDDGIIYLGSLAIDPSYQGKGWGREALSQFISKVKNAPKIKLLVHPENKPAVNLYESLGFKIIERKENYGGDGEPRIVMILEHASK